MPDLELGDELVNTLGTEAQSLFDKDFLTKKEEEDEVLKNLMENTILKILETQWMKLLKFQKVFIFFLWWQ